ncbi:MAG: acyltransferase family protein [Oscillospiraceae bacterium]|nr:acyltransferase family protein [Oscillospiraceae bacterium]
MFLKKNKILAEGDESLQKKKIHVEILRTIAIYFVMFNHTGGFFYFAKSIDDPLYYFYMSVSVLCKVAVPVFFMITGALLLKKEETLKTLITKRILKFSLILVTISLFYYLLLNRNWSVTDFAEKVYSTNITTGLWYLYSYIGILFMLPILRKLVKNLTEKEYLYIFICHLLFVGVVPILEYLIWQGEVTLNNNFSTMLFTINNVYYVLLGYYCENILDIKKITSKNIAYGILLSLIAIAVSCCMTNYKINIIGTEDNNALESFFSSLISIPSFTLYVVFRKLCAKEIPQRVEMFIAEIGGSVFGAYLFEKLIRMVTAFVYGGFNKIIGPFWASIVWVGAGMTFGLVIITLLKKIPFIGKYIRMVI